MDPKISVIISTYYRNGYLKEAIESVLSQNYDPVELIVVDDSGEAHAESVLADYNDLTAIIRDESGGWASAYTTGVEASTGEYIQFLDDDDTLLDGKLSKTAEVLQKNPDVGVSYCGVLRQFDGMHYPQPHVSGDILETVLRFDGFPLWTGSMLIEREVLTDCLPLPSYAADPDLKIALALRTKFDYVDECLAFYRQEVSKKWVGVKRFQEVRQVVKNRSDLYDLYPDIRREVLATQYEREGDVRLEQRLWSPMALFCFLKATYYADQTRVRCGGKAAASLFGQPALKSVKRVYRRAFVS